MGLFLFVVFCTLSVSPSFAAVQTVQTYVNETWSNTVYYLATLSGHYGQTQGYQDIYVTIAAADQYELYINGNLVGSGTLKTGANANNGDKYTVNLAGAKLFNIAVKVINNGIGHGNGLIIGIDAGTDQLGTSTKIRQSELILNSWVNLPIAWWTFDEQAKTSLGFGDKWYVFSNDPKTGLFADTNKTKFMKRAMVGSFAPDIDLAVFPPGVETVTGYLQSNVDTGSTVNGGIKLRKIEGENIARGKPAEKIEMTDGDLAVPIQISSPLGQSRYIDLGRIYSVKQMTIFTGGNLDEFAKNSLRGYSVEVSLDEYRYEEVGVIHEIGIDNEGGFDNYSVEFPEEWARFIRFKITEARPNDPMLSEVMVFGAGYVLSAYYESPWISLDSPTTFKNLDQVTWDAETPTGTKVTIQTMTAAGDTTKPSDWSTPMTDKSFQFMSPEPATHFKYRVNLSTQDLNRTPVFKNFSVEWSSADQPVSYADGFVTPNECPMAEETTFLYTLSYQLLAGQDLGEVAISVPSYSTLNWVYSSDTKANLAVTSKSTIDTLYVMFNSPITNLAAGGADTLYVSFNSSLLRSAHRFDAFVANSRANDNAGFIKAWENTQLGSNTVTVSSLVKSIITNVDAVPKVFTPNNDGMNDFTVIQFGLAKVTTRVKVKIYSTDGTLVATLWNDTLPPSTYSAPGDMAAAKDLPGAWNGENDDGDMVPPGIYIYQVVAETDNADVVESGTVVLAY